MMAKKLRKVFAMLLTLSMLMSMMSITAFAEGTAEKTQVVNEGGAKYYDEAGNPVEENPQLGTNAAVKVSKTLKATDIENEFDITLQVDTTLEKEDTIVVESAPDAAVVLTIDVSGTMDKTDMKNDKNQTATRIAVAIAKAKKFIEDYSATAGGTNAKRMVAITAFHTNAFQVASWFDVNPKNNEDWETELENALKLVKVDGDDELQCTNLDGALLLTRNQFYDEKPIEDIGYRYAVVLSDGAPTVSVTLDTLDADGNVRTAYRDYMDTNKTVGVRMRDMSDVEAMQSVTGIAGVAPLNPTSGKIRGGGWTHPAEVDRNLTYLEELVAEADDGVYLIGVSVNSEVIFDIGQPVETYHDYLGYTQDGSVDTVFKNVIDQIKNTTLSSTTKTSGWLKALADEIDTDASNRDSCTYRDANNNAGLTSAFNEIFEDIKVILEKETVYAGAWTTADPIDANAFTPYVDFLGFYAGEGAGLYEPGCEKIDWTLGDDDSAEIKTGEFAVESETGSDTPAEADAEGGETPAEPETQEGFYIDWDLKRSNCTTTKINDEQNIYTYSIKYRVRLMNEAEDFVPETGHYDTNGTTTFEFQVVDNGQTSETRSVEFPIPVVKGYLGTFSFTKVDDQGQPLGGVTFTLTHAANQAGKCGACSGVSIAPMTAESSLDDPATEDVNEAGVVTFSGIPSGHEYVLTETVPGEFVDNELSIDVAVKMGDVYSSELESMKWIVENIRKNLIVSKEVVLVNDDSLADEDLLDELKFQFTVTLSDNQINGKYGEITFTDGIASFNLKHGESKYAAGLPADITYTVTEEANESFKTASENPTGTIVAGETVNVAFTNTEKADAKWTPNAIKTLTGPALEENQFTFELRKVRDGETVENASLVESVKNAEDGTVQFSQIVYERDDIGTHTYIIKEKLPVTADGTIYDESVYQVTVVVSADEDGDLTKSVSYEKIGSDETVEAVEFINIADADLTVTKVVLDDAGNEVTAGGTGDKAFEFVVTLDDDSINGTYGDMTFENGVAGISLSHGQSKTALNLPKGIGYTVEETASSGYQLIDVSVVTGENDDSADSAEGDVPAAQATSILNPVTGTLVAGENVAITFTNQKIHVPVGTEWTPAATKQLNGATLTAEQFEFELKDAQGNVLQTKKNAADGTVTFDKIQYPANTPAGTYTYTISEKIPAEKAAGMVYDETVYEISVVISVAGNLDLSNTVAYAKKHADGSTTPANGAIFVNQATGDLEVSKTITGDAADKTLKFDFTVTLNDTSVSGTYGDMTFTNGVATFQLGDGEPKTATGLPAGVSYSVTEDAGEYTSSAPNGIQGAIVMAEKATAAFTNTKNKVYIPQDAVWAAKATKQLIGGELSAGQFEFELKDAQDAVLQTKTNAANGDVLFDAITYDTAGTYTYTIVEKIPAEAERAEGMTYDESVYTVVVTVAVANDKNDLAATAVYSKVGVEAETAPTAAAFVNTFVAKKYGSLKVTKTVVGINKDFDFTVTLGDTSINGAYGDMTFTNGVATFKLDNGAEKTATGLPAGISYEVTEDAGDYVSSNPNGIRGTIPAETTAVAAFVNTKYSSSDGGGFTPIIIDDEEPPLANLPDEEPPLAELPDEEVPLAMAPATGDASMIWMALSALSGAGLFLTRKKREDEE